jgi:hypothetical protein
VRRFRAQISSTADTIVRLGWNALRLSDPAGETFRSDRLSALSAARSQPA